MESRSTKVQVSLDPLVLMASSKQFVLKAAANVSRPASYPPVCQLPPHVRPLADCEPHVAAGF